MLRMLIFSLAVSSILGGSGLSAQSEYFPVEEETRWAYTDPNFGFSQEVSVQRRDGDSVTFAAGHEGSLTIVYRLRGDEVDVLSPDGEFGLAYRFESGVRFRHSDEFDCDDGVLASVALEERLVETPAGVFENCLRFEFTDFRCDDAGTTTEWFAPEVGKVKWQETSFVGEVTYELTEFARGPHVDAFYRRGDADGDGGVRLTDGVFLLNFLFLGGTKPECFDAADADGNQSLDLSDGVTIFNFLFLGGEAPPNPGPFDCGFDTEFDCERYGAC